MHQELDSKALVMLGFKVFGPLWSTFSIMDGGFLMLDPPFDWFLELVIVIGDFGSWNLDALVSMEPMDGGNITPRGSNVGVGLINGLLVGTIIRPEGTLVNLLTHVATFCKSFNVLAFTENWMSITRHVFLGRIHIGFGIWTWNFTTNWSNMVVL